MKKINPGVKSREKFILQLYVAGMSQRSMEAIENLKKICDQYLKNSFSLEIVDLYKNPEIASQQQIIFSPSLIKHMPLPKKTLVGSFSDSIKVIKALGISSNE